MGAVAPLHGLLLAGGRSRRMREDKALLRYHDQRTQLAVTHDLLSTVLDGEVKLSVRADQRDEPERARYAQLIDLPDVEGPASGIRAAQMEAPEAAWLVVACDLPRLDLETLRTLVERRDANADATAYVSSHDGLPEPLCAIWEPSSAHTLAAMLSEGRNCPRKALLRMNTTLIEQADPASLDNANTPDERQRIATAIDSRSRPSAPASSTQENA
ncbi:MAG: NTP transferase domain-containing protein [Pseudomonadota bacterium]